MNTRKWGIVNGGGDTPGMNAVIASIVKYGSKNGFEFFGFQKGWDGMLDNACVRLDINSVRGISHLGGTFLKTVNKGRFTAKIGVGQDIEIDEKILETAVKNAQELNLEGVFVIGGDGTQAGAVQLSKHGLKIVSIPKTIDNDLPFVSKTFGFSTAVGIGAESMQRLQTSATSHDRVFLVELMGRSAGWITLFAGLAGGADAILLPEFDFDIDKFIEHLKVRRESGRLFSIVAMSEGVKLSGAVNGDEREAGELRLHGASTVLEKMLTDKCGDEFEFRSLVLGHIQRGGPPNAEDMILAKSYGIAAIDCALDEDYGKMVVMDADVMKRIELSSIFGNSKNVKATTPELLVAQKLGIFVNC